MPPRRPAPTRRNALFQNGRKRLGLAGLVLGGCLAATFGHELRATEPSAALRACPRFNDGFWILPGTDTCLRIEGGVSSDVFAHGSRVGEDSFDGDPFVITRRPTRNARVSFETSGFIAFETRTPTAFGTLQTSLEFDTDQEKDDRTLGAGAREQQERRGEIELEKARIQLGGFTAGLSDSFFGIDNPVNYLGTHVADYGEDLMLLGYTATLSKDLSASIAVESGEVTVRVTKRGLQA